MKHSVQVTQVTKEYRLNKEKPTLIENLFRSKKRETFNALHDISFSIKQGECVGLIGANGSGKTTLLKLLAGITVPSSGSLIVQGSIVSLINISAGFHPELSGKENIYLNGLLIGLRKEEIDRNFKKIIDFADIGSFISAPFYTYSEGMKLRLGFSIGSISNPDVLLLDEALAVGDTSFQKKAKDVLNSFKKQKKTIVIASHVLPFLETFCTKIIWLHNGEIVKIGGKKLLAEYAHYVPKSTWVETA